MPFPSPNGIDYASQLFPVLQQSGTIQGRFIRESELGLDFYRKHMQLANFVHKFNLPPTLYSISDNILQKFYQGNLTGADINEIFANREQILQEIGDTGVGGLLETLANSGVPLIEDIPPEILAFIPDDLTINDVLDSLFGEDDDPEEIAKELTDTDALDEPPINRRGDTLPATDTITGIGFLDTTVLTAEQQQEIYDIVSQMVQDRDNEPVEARDYPLPRDAWILDTRFNVLKRGTDNDNNTIPARKTKRVEFWINPASVSFDYQLSMEEADLFGGVANTFWSNPQSLAGEDNNYIRKCIISFPFQTGNILPDRYNKRSEKNTIPPGLEQLYQIIYMVANQPRIFTHQGQTYNNYFYLQLHSRVYSNILFLGTIQQGINFTEDINAGFMVSPNITFHAYRSNPSWSEFYGVRFLEDLKRIPIGSAIDPPLEPPGDPLTAPQEPPQPPPDPFDLPGEDPGTFIA